MSSLLLFLCFFPSSYVTIKTENENIMYAYLAAFSGVAINKAWTGKNAITTISEGQLEAPADSSVTTERVVTRVSPSKSKVRK